MADEKEVNIDELRMRRFRQEAIRLIEEMRPERYVVSDGIEKEGDEEEGTPDVGWMDGVAKEVAAHLPDLGTKVLYAREKIGQMETAALRRGNRVLRTFDEQMHLGWLETASYPIAITERAVKNGVVRVKVERVRIRSCTPQDFRLFATEERKKAAADFETRNKTCRIAEHLADEMDKVQAKTFKQWVTDASQATGTE